MTMDPLLFGSVMTTRINLIKCITMKMNVCLLNTRLLQAMNKEMFACAVKC